MRKSYYKHLAVSAIVKKENANKKPERSSKTSQVFMSGFSAARNLLRLQDHVAAVMPGIPNCAELRRLIGLSSDGFKHRLKKFFGGKQRRARLG